MSAGAAVATPAFAVGCDVVDIGRLSRVIDRRPSLLERVFTATERADALRGPVAEGSPTERARLAARFAAKEATRKALGDLRLGFTAVEVRSGATGAPALWVRGRPSALSCSLSHDGGVAMALVIGPAAAPSVPAPDETAPTTIVPSEPAPGGPAATTTAR